MNMKKRMHENEENLQRSEEVSAEDKEYTENQEITEGTGNTSSAEAGDGSDIEAGADKIVEEVRAFEEKLAEIQDKYIRLSAEFDNYRKRTLREKMELSKYAEENILLKVVPFMDDFDRAIQHIDTAADFDAMRNGINLIYMKFSEFLKQNGVKEIEAMGADFNVDLHEAVAKLQVGEADKKGKVVDVVLKGYYLREKVLRFSKVVVGE